MICFEVGMEVQLSLLYSTTGFGEESGFGSCLALLLSASLVLALLLTVEDLVFATVKTELCRADGTLALMKSSS